jgi:AbrB family looped-hinge helix DNA binding protein
MSKVTSKLQVTIPKVIAEKYGIGAGAEVIFEPAGDVVKMRLAEKRPRRVEDDHAWRSCPGRSSSSSCMRTEWWREDWPRREGADAQARSAWHLFRVCPTRPSSNSSRSCVVPCLASAELV